MRRMSVYWCWQCWLRLRCFAQQAAREAEIRQAAPYAQMLRSNPELTYDQYREAVRELARQEVARQRRAPRGWQTAYELLGCFITRSSSLPAARSQLSTPLPSSRFHSFVPKL